MEEINEVFKNGALDFDIQQSPLLPRTSSSNLGKLKWQKTKKKNSLVSNPQSI